MSRVFALAALLLFSLFIAPARAEEPQLYNIDKDHTRVVFFVDHLGFSHMPGVFNDVTGTINFDHARAEESNVNVRINARAVSVNHKALDAKLQGAEYFNTAKFPIITFKSTKIETTGLETGLLTGDLTMLGVTKPVTLDVRFNHKGWNNYASLEAIGFTATGKISRSDFGMRTMLPDVGDDIELRIELEAQLNASKLPAGNATAGGEANIIMPLQSGGGGLNAPRRPMAPIPQQRPAR